MITREFDECSGIPREGDILSNNIIGLLRQEPPEDAYEPEPGQPFYNANELRQIDTAEFSGTVLLHQVCDGTINPDFYSDEDWRLYVLGVHRSDNGGEAVVSHVYPPINRREYTPPAGPSVVNALRYIASHLES